MVRDNFETFSFHIGEVNELNDTKASFQGAQLEQDHVSHENVCSESGWQLLGVRKRSTVLIGRLVS